MIKLSIRRLDHLPRLSWCTSLKRGSAVAEVVCGPWVETGDDFFVEGAWDGRFEERGFDRSFRLMGSGAKSSENGLVVATPCHNLESLFLVSDGSTLIVSNSLSFLLVTGALELDGNYLHYKQDLRSSQLGLKRCVKTIPTKNGPDIRVLRYTNLSIGDDLDVKELPKPSVPDWADFEQYRSFLVEGLRAINENAGTPERRIPYELLATVSSGYDSSASAALATEAGAERAVTVHTGGNESRELVDDSGAGVAAALGLQITEYGLPDMESTSETTFAEFAACGDLTELNFIAIEPELEAKVVTTGHSGGFWRLDFPSTTTLTRPDPGGSALNEFRLRVGFIHVPVPMMGGIRHPRVQAIGSSTEMASWSVAGDYNRPIPRRILEEKDVPRGSFARAKKGGVVAVVLSPRAAEYYRQHRGDRTLLARVRLYSRWRTAQLRRKVVKLFERLNLRRRRFNGWYIFRPGPESLIVQWGTSVVRERYRPPSGPGFHAN